MIQILRLIFKFSQARGADIRTSVRRLIYSEIHLTRRQTAHPEFRFCFCLLEFDMFQSLESDEIAKEESNSTLQLSSDHEETLYHHFSLSLVEVIRNTKCLYLQILGYLYLHFLSKYHF